MIIILSGNQTLHETRGDSLRRSGRLLNSGIGIAHTRAEIIDLIHYNDAIISTRDTGEILAEFTLNPAHGHQRKNG